MNKQKRKSALIKGIDFNPKAHIAVIVIAIFLLVVLIFPPYTNVTWREYSRWLRMPNDETIQLHLRSPWSIDGLSYRDIAGDLGLRSPRTYGGESTSLMMAILFGFVPWVSVWIIPVVLICLFMYGLLKNVSKGLLNCSIALCLFGIVTHVFICLVLIFFNRDDFTSIAMFFGFYSSLALYITAGIITLDYLNLLDKKRSKK